MFTPFPYSPDPTNMGQNVGLGVDPVLKDPSLLPHAY